MNNQGNCEADTACDSGLIGGVALAPFKSCTIEEKIQRLHSELRQLRSDFFHATRLNTELRRKLYLLENHYHAPNGEMAINMKAVPQEKSQLVGEPQSPFDVLR